MIKVIYSIGGIAFGAVLGFGSSLAIVFLLAQSLGTINFILFPMIYPIIIGLTLIGSVAGFFYGLKFGKRAMIKEQNSPNLSSTGKILSMSPILVGLSIGIGILILYALIHFGFWGQPGVRN